MTSLTQKGSSAFPSAHLNQLPKVMRASSPLTGPQARLSSPSPSPRIQLPASTPIAPFVIAGDGTFGIDKIEFKMQVDPNSFAVDDKRWRRVTYERDGVTQDVFNSDGCPDALLPCRLVFYGEPLFYAKVQLNPSRLLDPEGTSLCDPADLARTIGILLLTLEDLLLPLRPDGGSIADLTPIELAGLLPISRMDIARDFATTDPGRHLRHATKLYTPRWTTTTYYNGGRLQTVNRGKKTEFFRMYDKSVESDGVAPDGTLRCELQARKPWLNAGQITTIASATPTAISALFLNKWGRTGFGEPVDKGSTYVALGRLGKSPAVGNSLLGYLQARADGEPTGLSLKTRKDYNALAAGVGLLVGDPVRTTGGLTYQLDVESGKEIISSAPPC